MPASSCSKPSWSHLRSLQHSGGGLWVTHWFHRAGVVLAWVYSRLGMSPNAITLFSFLLSAMGALLLILTDEPSFSLCVAVFLILALAYASDCSDGQLARATNRCSKLGAWLDHVLDTFRMLLLHFTLGWVGLRAASGHSIAMHWPFLALALGLGGEALYFFAWNYKVQLLGKDSIGGAMTSGRVKTLLKLPLQFTDFGIFILLILLVPYESLIVWAYLGHSAVSALLAMAYLVVTWLFFPKHVRNPA